MKITHIEINAVRVHLLDREVVVLDAKLLDASPGALLARANTKRIENGLSWREVARQAGTTSPTLSRWATKQTLPSARTLTAIAKWLEKP